MAGRRDHGHLVSRNYPKKRIFDVKKRLLSGSHQEDMGYVTPCLRWDGEKDKNGYGQIKDKGKYVWVHHVFKGRPPEGLETDHLCETRDCSRPSHLEWVTREENLRRRDEAVRRRKDEQV
jgi:hypothetical protein